MFILSFANRTGAKRRRTISAFAATAFITMLAGVPSAQATTYKFVVPTTTVQSALAAAVTAGSDNPLLYGFYDIYIRPALPADGVGGNNLPSYTPDSDVAPITSGNDQWTATTGVKPFDSPTVSFRYFFTATDTFVALVTTNANVAGKNIEGRTGEQMPGSNTFQMTISSASALLTGQIRFVVTARSYQFWDTAVSTQGGNAYHSKGSIWSGTFDASGSEVPEPASMLSFGGGATLLALILRRRRRSPDLQKS